VGMYTWVIQTNKSEGNVYVHTIQLRWCIKKFPD
jgi:hypothetical protein